MPHRSARSRRPPIRLLLLSTAGALVGLPKGGGETIVAANEASPKPAPATAPEPAPVALGAAAPAVDHIDMGF